MTAVWRAESARLIAALTRMTGDLGLAEDVAQDALVAALDQWPREGVPANPGAWLTAVGKRRAIDHFRRAEQARRGEAAAEPSVTPDFAVDHIEDDVLRLIFLTCHPSLTPESRAALTLRMVAGLTTEAIASAFLVADKTMGQRIARAKATVRGAPFELPDARQERLGDVMAVIYLIFNEGYAAAQGDHWMRPELCLEALRLARRLAALEPSEPEVHGLQALLELQASRTRARRGPDGAPVLLEAQDRARWDWLLIDRGLAALDRAEATGRPVGPYVLQATIAACHARARRAADTDWERIAELYDLAAEVFPSPVVEINRALAHGRAHGPDAGLAIADAVDLPGSPMVGSVRGDLLERRGDRAGAARAFAQAAALTRNADERRLLERRAADNGG